MPERAETRMEVQKFVGHLLTDSRDCDTFFGGRRHTLLTSLPAKFALTEEEKEILLRSEATNLQELAQDLIEALDIPLELPE
jgi:hypothetical protein